jgi:hypothetical protein
MINHQGIIINIEKARNILEKYKDANLQKVLSDMRAKDIKAENDSFTTEVVR